MALVSRRCVLLRLSDRHLLLRSSFSPKLADLRTVRALSGRRGDASSSWSVGRSLANFSISSNFGGEPGSTGLNSGRAVECIGIGHDIRVLSCSVLAIEIFSERTVGLRVCRASPW